MKNLLFVIVIIQLFCFSTNYAQWQPINNGLNGISIQYPNDIVFSGQNIYCLSENNGYDNQGIFFSSNNGETWSLITDSIFNTYSSILSIAVSGSNLYVGGYNTLYYSTNYGADWKVAFNINSSIRAIAVNNNLVIAGSEGDGVYISLDYGKSWQGSNNGLPNASINTLTIKDNFIFATTNYRVYKSSDNGFSWMESDNGISDKNIYSLVYSDNKIFAGTHQGIYFSSNNGGIWSRIDHGITNVTFYKIAVSGNYIFAGNYDGIYRTSNNGTSWEFLNNISSNPDILVANESNILAGYYNKGIMRSSDFGNTWVPANRSNASCVFSLTQKNNDIYTGINGGLFKSTNKGDNWLPFNQEFANDSILSIAFNGNDIFIGTNGQGIYHSIDNGITWIPANKGLTYNKVNNIAVDRNYIYACTPGGIFVSSDYGHNWSAKNSGILDLEILSIVVINGKIYLGTQNGMYFSTNNGNLWQSIDLGYVRSVYTIVENNGNIYAGTSNGIYFTKDNGDTWEQLGKAYLDYVSSIVFYGKYIITNSYNQLLITQDNGNTWKYAYGNLKYLKFNKLLMIGDNIFAGTSDNGIFRAYISDLIAFTDVPIVSESAKFNIFPNPANEKINIICPDNYSKDFTVNIVDNLGCTVFEKNYPENTGGNLIEINTSNFTHGFYLCHIKTKDFIDTKKLLINR